jgi:hypothetical protein
MLLSEAQLEPNSSRAFRHGYDLNRQSLKINHTQPMNQARLKIAWLSLQERACPGYNRPGQIVQSRRSGWPMNGIPLYPGIERGESQVQGHALTRDYGKIAPR